MHLNNIYLQNFRCFEEQSFWFAPRVNLLVGDNASGKSALIDAIRVALSSYLNLFPDPAANGIQLVEYAVRHALFMKGRALTRELQYPCKVLIETQFVGQTDPPYSWEVLRTVPERKPTVDPDLGALALQLRNGLQSGKDVALPLFVAFGTQRLWLQSIDKQIATTGPDSRLQGYENCLESSTSQNRMLEWFKKFEFAALQQGEELPILEACRKAVTTCVPDATHVYFDVQYNQLVLLINDEPFPFWLLSDGYRSMLAMIADIAVRCATLNPHLEANAPLETEGVVLIDEIDLHLHPKWQRRVLGDLMQAFPRLQFVTTTHSPFVIQSLPNDSGAKLINLDDPDNQRFADQSVEDIAEQIQGVELPQRSRRYLEMMNKAQQYFQILERDEAVSAEERLAVRQQLEKAVMPHSDSPAYQAFIRMQELAKLKNVGKTSTEREGTP